MSHKIVGILDGFNIELGIVRMFHHSF